MLDPEESGSARFLAAGEAVPQGVQPVVLAESTVYGLVCVEQMLRQWPPVLPRPWLVLLADAPADLPPAARYRLRALEARLAGVARVPYLPSLRLAESPEAALAAKDVQTAAAKLRRTLEGKK